LATARHKTCAGGRGEPATSGETETRATEAADAAVALREETRAARSEREPPEELDIPRADLETGRGLRHQLLGALRTEGDAGTAAGPGPPVVAVSIGGV
jgi:hypothetical protein